MSGRPDPELERLAESVADGDPLDWDAVMAADPALAARITALRSLERLAGAHREARADLTQSQLATLDLAASAERAAALESVPPVFTWGFLRALGRLGEGSFGEVWRAYDPTLHREVALKLRRLPPDQQGVPNVAATMDVRARHWLGEARRLASVRHPHVLTVFGAAVHDGRAGLWTELIRGETLEERLARTGPLPPREVASIGVDLCAALAAVHEAGLVHGDVKPANVMLEPASRPDERPRVVLMDFGAAHETSSRERALAMTAGTPLLMAPELLEGGAATAASDLYAAGVVLFRLLSGRWPVAAATLEELRARHQRGERLNLDDARPGLPRPLVRPIEQALAARPAERFASALEMRRALFAVAAPDRARRTRTIAAIAGVAVLAAAVALWSGARQPSTDRVMPRGQLRPASDDGLLRAGPVLEGTAIGEYYASCVEGAGDVNGDGLVDVLVGSLGFSGTLEQQGRAQLLLGSADGLSTSPAWEVVGTQAGEAMGAFLAGGGDVNGDGFDDALVLSRWTRPADRMMVGRVLLYLGRPGGLAPEPAWTLEGDQAGAYLGNGIAIVGDVNRDGFDDAVIGCVTCRETFDSEGRMQLFLGSPRGLAAEPARVWHGGSLDANLGWRAARIGDVNGDGFDDVLLAASHWSGPLGREGRVQIDYGGPQGPDGVADWSAVGGQRDGGFGWSVGGGGDVDGDGYADFVLSEYTWTGRSVQEGRVLLFRGGRSGPSATPAWTHSGYGAFASIGAGWIGIARDLDGDGRGEVFASTPNYSPAADSQRVGVAVVAGLEPDGRKARAVWRWIGDHPGIPIGWSVAAPGDLDGDGLGDLLVNHPNYPGGNELRGRLMVFYGRRGTAAGPPR
jgi:hypothetical protein